MIVLPLAYLGSVQYFSKLCSGDDVVVDIHEHYIKQSLRNRCEILTAEGVTTLYVNIVKAPNEAKLSVKDTRIDYSKRWQHDHWNSLVSAYRNSPYFDFYAERFEPFYQKKYDFLFDLNSELIVLILELLGRNTPLKFSGKYIDPATPGITDLRHCLSSKPRLHRPDQNFHPVPYYQVFSDKYPFAPNLSIVDLLFCEGPGARKILRSSFIATV